jgi:uncharacterized protein (DUF433 family)
MQKLRNSTVIEQRDGLRGGKPVLKGSRVTIEEILNHLSLGWSIPQLKEAFPSIKGEYIVKLLRDISKDYAAKK